MQKRKELDNLIREEVNVKVLSRYIASTEKGNLTVDFDGKKYFISLDNKKIEAPKLLRRVMKLLCTEYAKNA